MRIKNIEIKSFRGISKSLSITFPIKNNKPASLVILGDNGVGKSSIVDAIEFGLQGHISQHKLANTSTTPSIKSFNSNDLPEVIIKFENDEVIERKIIKDEQGLLSNLLGPHKLFSVSPFVLRRYDILRFINSSTAERILVFSNYFREDAEQDWKEHPIDELNQLQEERLNLKIQRDALRKLLAEELKIEIENIPFTRRDFKEFIEDKIYKGFSKDKFEIMGVKFKINKKALELSERVIDAIENHRKLKSEIRKYSIDKHITTYPKHLLTQLNEFLGKVSEKLTSSFLQISPLKFINRIEIEYNDKNVLALSVNLKLNNNEECKPIELLSEANLDLLALLFFLAFVQESAERGQAKILILDDVLQSIDSTIRVNFLSFLLRNFPEWQFIITAHDKLWQRQLNDLMNLHGHQFSNLSIVDWSFDDGPILQSHFVGRDESLKSAIGSNDLLGICSQSGMLLDQICDALSRNLNSTIQRKTDDKYTLGDLFPGINKLLKKTELRETVEEVEKWLHLRNLIGAHFNEWALALSLEEAKQFANSVKTLFNKVNCVKCSTWLINNANLSYYSCKCGAILIQKK